MPEAGLSRDDQAHRAGWTLDVFLSGVSTVIDAHPGIRAGDLWVMVGQEKTTFKLNVRRLKALGLTESLEVGYRLSPRGKSLLRRLREGE